MITKIFDQGWGSSWRWKNIEQRMVCTYLAPVMLDQSRTVLINSVWYTGELHQEVLQWLRHNPWDQIVLVAMLDPAICQPEWYDEFDRPVHAVGYYPNQHCLDFFAMLLDETMNLSCYTQLQNQDLVDTAYLCLNRKPHWHRKKLYSQLLQNDLLDKGLVTMGGGSGTAERKLAVDVQDQSVAPNIDNLDIGIVNDVNSLGLPENWQRCLVNVVTETIWNIKEQHFVSEKIYKPILGERPFFVYASDGAIGWLNQRKFETFGTEFRDISDHDPSDPNQLINFLSDLCRQPKQYLAHKLNQLQPKLQYNKQNFYEYVKDQRHKLMQGFIAVNNDHR